jgi:HD-GYP domain-containing protein (c-di-GMP phosphodiesterase class II)
VDVFDALTTDRPYRKALPVATAYQMLTDDARSGWCDSSIVESFIDLHRSRSRRAMLRAALTVDLEPSRIAV